MLKITDYGLRKFKEGAANDGDITEHTFYQGEYMYYVWEKEYSSSVRSSSCVVVVVYPLP